MQMRHRVPKLALLGLLPFMGACSDTVGIVPTPEALQSVVGTESIGDGARVWLCKLGPAGTTADFRVTADGPGTLLLGEAFTISAYPECVAGVNRFDIWIAESPRPDPLVNTILTVEEVAATPGMSLALIDYAEYQTGIYRLAYPPTTSASITVNHARGGRFKFTNEGAPFEGCTPGYWRQPHHFDSWPHPYTPNTPFADVFADVFGTRTLRNVVVLNGGGLNALGRHTVAALLNAASDEVHFGLTVAEVIEAFNAAVASRDYEATKDRFEYLNELGCPLN